MNASRLTPVEAMRLHGLLYAPDEDAREARFREIRRRLAGSDAPIRRTEPIDDPTPTLIEERRP